MEHFLLPQDPSSSPVKVPYVCQEPYDGGPFLEYPIRKKKSWLLPDTENPRFMPYRLREVLHPTPTREQEAFLQTWLFFGLLHTLQGETFDAEDYIVTATSNPKLRYISTSKMLPNLDDARRRRTIPATDADKKKQLEQVSQYLKVAMNVSRAVQEDFDWRIRLSIVSVCETIAHSLWASFKWMGINGPQVGGFFYNFYNEEIRAEMRRNGWCPCDIARVVDKFQHFQTLYFVSKMKRIDSVLDHERCTSELCALYQTDREAYRTKHCQQGCNCPDASINPATVSAILRRGNIPLLRIVELKGRAGEVCVEVVESTTDTPYVPISHVWKDGMGNPNSNALPQCQLRHVSRLVNLLKTGLFAEPTSEPLLFWIDTLCCPVEPLDDKLLAISMLHKTYVEATAVLVMDAGLQLCDHREIHGVETLARLYTSGWMHRLWTLQEGGLAKRLFFQFKHEAIDLEQQYRELQATMPSDVRFLGPYMDFNKQQTAVMNFVVPGQPTGEDWHKVGAQLRRIDTALQNRSTTVEADEPLCMATLLDLNIDFRSVPETLNARMCHIWTSVAAKYGGLPQQMIFLEHSKLKVRGFQWAPESLLHASGNDRFGPHARLSFWSDSELGQINRRGFLVEYPGFKLERSHPMGRNPGETLRVPLEFQVAFTANNGILYQIGRIETNASEIVKDGRQFIHDLICQGSCALVAKEPWTKGSPKELVVQALIVDIMEADSCILYSRIRCHVILIEALPSMRLAVMHAERLGQVLREAPTSKRAIELMSNEQSAEYIVAVAALQAKAKEIAGDALENVPGLSDAVSDSFGGDEALGGYWTFVTLAYRYGSFKGTALPRSQKWCLE